MLGGSYEYVSLEFVVEVGLDHHGASFEEAVDVIALVEGLDEEGR